VREAPKIPFDYHLNSTWASSSPRVVVEIPPGRALRYARCKTRASCICCHPTQTSPPVTNTRRPVKTVVQSIDQSIDFASVCCCGAASVGSSRVMDGFPRWLAQHHLRRFHRHRSLPQSSSASRFTAAHAGVFHLQPIRRASSPLRFDTMPSSPILQAWPKTVGPSPSMCSLKRRPRPALASILRPALRREYRVRGQSAPRPRRPLRLHRMPLEQGDDRCVHSRLFAPCCTRRHPATRAAHVDAHEGPLLH